MVHPLLTSALTVGAVGAAGLGYAALIERNLFALRTAELPVLPEGSDPLRVLHLSDLHLVPRQTRKREWVRTLGDLRPDLVVNTGDNLSALDAVPAVLDTFGGLLDIPGVFVMGSNDYYAPHLKNPARYLTSRHAERVKAEEVLLPTDELVDGFERRGWVNLNNRRATLDVAGHRLDFIGLDDPHINRDRHELVAGPVADDAALGIGVVHAPYRRALDALTSDGVGAIIAGHTHGGQLAIPGYGALVTNCDLGTDRVKGVSRWWEGADNAPSSEAPDDAAWMNVSAGLGTSPFAPVRFACRPEASLLTLVARS